MGVGNCKVTLTHTFQGQGLEGEADAEPGQGARTHGEDRTGAFNEKRPWRRVRRARRAVGGRTPELREFSVFQRLVNKRVGNASRRENSRIEMPSVMVQTLFKVQIWTKTRCAMPLGFSPWLPSTFRFFREVDRSFPPATPPPQPFGISERNPRSRFGNVARRHEQSAL